MTHDRHISRRTFLQASAVTGLSATTGVAVGGTLIPAQRAHASLAGADFYAMLDLDRPELSGVAAKVAEGDYAGADQALYDFYAGREAPLYFPAEANPDDIPRALDIVNGHFEFPGGMERDYYDSDDDRIDVDWDDPWAEYEDPPVNAPSMMNRFSFYPDLVGAYLAVPAGDPLRDDVAVAWMQLAQDFIADKGDVPIGAAPHNRLTEAIRLQSWLAAFSVFRQSSVASAADLVAYLDYMRQSAQDIKHNIESHKGNNHYISMARALYLAAAYLPEFADASIWRFKATSAAARYIDRNMRRDGLSHEPALNYQNYSLRLLAVIQEFGTLNGDTPLAERELSLAFRQAEALAAVIMPNFTIPLFGDSSAAELDLSGVETFADEFDRPDLRWVVSDGTDGVKPGWDSMLYPKSYAVMRSGWDVDDQYMFIGNQDTNYNASHRHPDDLGVVAYAYGRPLVVDPGVYDLSDSESATWLRRTTEAHNTVEVGGVPQPKSTQAQPSARRSLQWYSNDGFDFYQGEHEDYQPIIHSRSVFSPKPGFWIVSDVLAGSPGSEDYRQLWHFPHDASVAVGSGTEVVTAGFGDVSGVVIAPVDPGKTTTNHHTDGYLTEGFDNLHSGVDYVSFSQTTSDTATFDTLLYPGDAGSAPSVATSRIPLSVASDVATAMQVDLADGGYGVYYLSHEKAPTTRTAGTYEYDGRLFYAERNASGDLVRLSLAAGAALVDGGTTLVSSPKPMNDLSVTYDGGQLVLSAGVPLESELSVHAPGVTDVVLNGTNTTFTRDGEMVTIAAPELKPAATPLLDEQFGAVRDGGIREWNFVDGSAEHWVAQRGDWSVTQDGNGEWAYRQTNSDAVRGQTVVVASLDDVTVSTEVTRGAAARGNNAVGVLLRHQDADNHYELRLFDRASGAVFAQIIARFDGEVTVLASEAVSIDLDVPHELTGTVHADRIQLAVDGSTLATATDDRLTTGGIGLAAHRAEASFGSIRLDASTVWDFDNGDANGWRGLVGSWTATDGVFRQTDRSQSTGVAMVEHDAADVDVSATVQRGRTGSSAHGFGIAVRMHDHRTYYMARIYRTSSLGPVAQLFKRVGGSRTDFTGSGIPLSLDVAEPHHLRVRASGYLFQFWIDDELVATVIDEVDSSERIPTGGVGLHAHNTIASFDDVSVAELTDPQAWSASRGTFIDQTGNLTMLSSGVEYSQLKLARTVSWRDYVAEATFLPTDWNGPGELGLVVRSTSDTLGYRCVLVDTRDGTYARIERLTTGSRAITTPDTIAEEPVSFAKTGPLPMEVVVRGSTIELRLDGVLVASATDTVIGRGGVSIIGSDVNANVTNVLVRELVEDGG